MNESQRIIASENVAELQNIFDKSFAVYGTALGAIRENNIIAHDLDTDLGIFSEDFKWSSVNEAVKKGYEILHVFGSRHYGMEISFAKLGIKTDLMLFYPRGEWKRFNCLWLHGGENIMMDSVIHEYPIEVFTQELVMFGHNQIRSLGEEYLKTVYGEEWRTPVEKFDWKTDHKCKRY